MGEARAGAVRIAGVEVGPRAVRSAGGRVIPYEGIVGAEVETIAANRAAGALVAVGGLIAGGLCVATGSEAQMVGLVFGLGAVAIGVAMALSAKDRHVVYAIEPRGRKRVLLGTDARAQADEIAAAVNRARDAWAAAGDGATGG